MGRTPDDDVDDHTGLEDSFDEPSDEDAHGEHGDGVRLGEDDTSSSSGAPVAAPEADDEDDWTMPALGPTEAPSTGASAAAESGQALAAVPGAQPPPLPGAHGGGRLMHVLRPHGHWNQRVVLVGVVVVIAVVLFLVSGNSSDPFKARGNDTQQQGQAARDLFGPGAAQEVTPLRTSERGGGALVTPELGSPGQAVNFGNNNLGGAPDMSGAPPGTANGVVPPPVIPPVVSYAPPVPNNSSRSTSTGSSAELARRDVSALGVSPPGAENSFAVRLRAGTRAEDQAAQRAERQAEEGSARATMQAEGSDSRPALARGLRLQLMLLEPVRSGISTSVTARVVADVRDARGQRIVPAGSTAVIPFLPQEVNGRVVNDRAGEGFIILPDGAQLALRGTVKGADGFAGLTGRVRRTGGRSALRRVGGALARAGSSVVGSQTGISAYEVEDVIGANGGAYTAPSERVVEVPAGARFSFTVGL